MFIKKDYLNYFHQLYQIEIEMKKEIAYLMKIVSRSESKELLKKIHEDEVRHAIIVKELIKLV